MGNAVILVDYSLQWKQVVANHNTKKEVEVIRVDARYSLEIEDIIRLFPIFEICTKEQLAPFVFLIKEMIAVLAARQPCGNK